MISSPHFTQADNDCLRLLIIDVGLLIKYNAFKNHVIVILKLRTCDSIICFRPAYNPFSVTPKKPPSVKPMTPRNMNRAPELEPEDTSPPPPKIPSVKNVLPKPKPKPKPMPRTALDDLGDMPIDDTPEEIPQQGWLKRVYLICFN